jgi:hypothetical protein
MEELSDSLEHLPNDSNSHTTPADKVDEDERFF